MNNQYPQFYRVISYYSGRS